jgi:hypothetical protein
MLQIFLKNGDVTPPTQLLMTLSIITLNHLSDSKISSLFRIIHFICLLIFFSRLASELVVIGVYKDRHLTKPMTPSEND